LAVVAAQYASKSSDAQAVETKAETEKEQK